MAFEQNSLKIPAQEEIGNGISVPRGYVLFNGKHIPLYPRGDYSTGAPILNALGAFWSQHFEDRGELLGLYKASSSLVIQSYLNYMEAIASTSRFDVPIYHRRIWYAIILRESQLSTGHASMLKYDGTASYDGVYQYGQVIGNRFEEVGLESLKNVSVIFNRIIDPSVNLVSNTDFYIENDALFLRDNPFENNRFAVSSILDSNGNVEDREVVLWAFDSFQDWEHIYQHYGYAIRHKTASSQSYKNLVNSMWNGLVGGPSTSDIEWALSAMAGIPTVLESQEVVDAILPYSDKTVIVTDLNAYIYPAGSVASVSVGDTVRSRQSLVDTVAVYDLSDFNRVVTLLTAPRITDAGKVQTRTIVSGGSSSSSSSGLLSKYLAHRQPSKIDPDLDDGVVPLLEFLPLGPGLLGNGYTGAISFKNEKGVIDVSTTDDDGVIKAKINTVDGAPIDITKFWDDAHDEGIANNKTWLDLLGTPIPSYINPAGFAIEQFLRNHGLIVYLRYSKFSNEAIGTHVTGLLRSIMLPEKLILYMLDVDISENNVIPTEEALNFAVDVASDTAACTVGDPKIYLVDLCE